MMVKYLKEKSVFLIIFGVLFFVSCSYDEINESVENISTEEIQKLILADDVSAEVNDILDQDEIDDPYSGKGLSVSGVATCATRTVVRTLTKKTVTLDFGNSCIGRNQKEYAGKIIIAYWKSALGVSKTVTFERFSINQNTIEGSKSVIHKKSNTAGNPESIITNDITITLISGDIITRKGRKSREKIKGSETRDRGDDVYVISGYWESTDKNGIERKSIITTKLRRTYACRFIVSGVVEISKNNTTATLDFGNGSCDNIATITDARGDVREIKLKR